MATKKQRRRRQKGLRHEYEYVYVDDDGREVAVEDADDAPEAAPAKPKAAAAKAEKSPAKRGAARSARSTRTIQPPSWRRVGKRALIFAPLMFVTLTLLADELTVGQRAFQTVYLLAIFIPFTYLMDRFMYRRFVRSGGAAAGPSRRR